MIFIFFYIVFLDPNQLYSSDLVPVNPFSIGASLAHSAAIVSDVHHPPPLPPCTTCGSVEPDHHHSFEGVKCRSLFMFHLELIPSIYRGLRCSLGVISD